MKKVILILFFTFLFQGIGRCAQLGILECGSMPNLSNISTSLTPTSISANNISSLNASETPILFIICYNNINTLSIEKYLANGGKLILSLPKSTQEFSSFQKLAKTLGVNVENIEITQNETEIYWIEKTLINNTLPKNSQIAKTTLLQNTKALAVFGQLEKHESAITLNNKGGIILWRWGIDGHKSFNNKNLYFLLEELIGSSNIINSDLAINENFNEKINSLEKNREDAEKYINNIINFSNDLAPAQEELEKSKIHAIYAKNNFKNFKNNEADILLKKSRIEILNSIGKIPYKPNFENRGIWFDRGTIVNIKSQEEMGRYFDKLKSGGINTIYFETFNAGYTIYPSNLTAQNPLTKGVDPLRWAVIEAHKRNIKIHAWIWVFAVGNTRHNSIINKPQSFEGPILSKHPDWALIGGNGNYQPKNQPEFWLDPTCKQAKQFIISLGQEITRKYDIDGIQLDYIRYPFQKTDNLMGFNPNSIEQFQITTGEKLFTNDTKSLNMWNKWKEYNINQFVDDFSKSTKKIRPSIKISASVFCKNYTERFNSIQQNWESWAKNSSVDIITPMSYSVSNKALASNLDVFPQTVCQNCLIYPGIALKHVKDTEILNQIETVRNYGFSGMTFFAYSQFDEDKENFMKNYLFKTQASDPTYYKHKAAISYINDYKKALEIYINNSNDLTQEARVNASDLLQKTNNILLNLNGSQNPRISSDMEVLINLTERFEKKYICGCFCRSSNLTGYLKRAKNLL